jgi:hypothetical protein
MPDPWPTDAAIAPAILAGLVRDIDARSEQEHEVVMAEFMVTAWPSRWARTQ